MSAPAKLKPFPVHQTDAEAEAFIENADLTEYDLSEARPLSSFEFGKKDASIHMRLPQGQLDEIKAEARKRGMPYQRLMRELLARGMQSLHHQDKQSKA